MGLYTAQQNYQVKASEENIPFDFLVYFYKIDEFFIGGGHILKIEVDSSNFHHKRVRPYFHFDNHLHIYLDKD